MNTFEQNRNIMNYKGTSLYKITRHCLKYKAKQKYGMIEKLQSLKGIIPSDHRCDDYNLIIM